MPIATDVSPKLLCSDRQLLFGALESETRRSVASTHSVSQILRSGEATRSTCQRREPAEQLPPLSCLLLLPGTSRTGLSATKWLWGLTVQKPKEVLVTAHPAWPLFVRVCSSCRATAPCPSLLVTAPRQVLDCTSPAMSFHVSPADGHPAALSCWGGTVCAEAECAARDGALGTHTAPEALWDGAVLPHGLPPPRGQALRAKARWSPSWGWAMLSLPSLLSLHWEQHVLGTCLLLQQGEAVLRRTEPGQCGLWKAGQLSVGFLDCTCLGYSEEQRNCVGKAGLRSRGAQHCGSAWPQHGWSDGMGPGSGSMLFWTPGGGCSS